MFDCLLMPTYIVMYVYMYVADYYIFIAMPFYCVNSALERINFLDNALYKGWIQ